MMMLCIVKELMHPIIKIIVQINVANLSLHQTIHNEIILAIALTVKIKMIIRIIENVIVITNE